MDDLKMPTGPTWLLTATITQFKHPAKKGRVTVTHSVKDIPIKTLKSIEKQAGVEQNLLFEKNHSDIMYLHV